MIKQTVIDDRRPFATRQPKLRCALHSHWFQAEPAGSKAGLEATLDALPESIFVLGGPGRILFANARAHELPTSALAVAHGELRGVGHVDAAELRALLRMTRAGVAQAVPFWAPDGDDFPTGALHLRLLAMEGFAYGGVWPGADVLAVVRLDQRDAIRRARIRAVVQRYGLTCAEEKVLHALARGLCPDEAAGELGVSMNTVRTHIRHVLQKVRGRRIADVLNLL